MKAIRKLLTSAAISASLFGGLEDKVSAQSNIYADSARAYYSDQINSNIYNVNVNSTDPNYVSNGGLNLEVLSKSSTNMNIAVKNTIPNSEIWLIEKDDLIFNPTNHWNPIFSFTPTSAYTTLSIPTTNQDKQFFAAMEINNYYGPPVSITSFGPNSSISGENMIQVSTGMDIFNLNSINLYANGNNLPPIGTNGNTFYFNSQSYMNGPVIFQATAQNSLELIANQDDPSSSTSPTYARSWSRAFQVFAENDVFLLNNPDYSSGSTFPIKLLSMTPMNTSVDVTEVGSTNTIYSAGTSDPDIFYPYNYTYIDATVPGGQDSYFYDVNINWSDIAKGTIKSKEKARGTTMSVTLAKDRGGVRHGESFVAFGEWKESRNETPLCNDLGTIASYIYYGAVTEVGWPESRGTVEELVDPPFYLEVKRGAKNQEGINYCYYIFQNPKVSEFTTKGHGGNYIWVGTNDNSLATGLYAPNVAQMLKNVSTNFTKMVQGNLVTYRHFGYQTRYNISHVDGCMTYEEPNIFWQWCDTFGAPAGINQDEGRDDMEPNGSLENGEIAYMSATYFNFQKYFNMTYRTIDTAYPAKYIFNLSMEHFDISDCQPVFSGSGRVMWLSGRRN